MKLTLALLAILATVNAQMYNPYTTMNKLGGVGDMDEIEWGNKPWYGTKGYGMDLPYTSNWEDIVPKFLQSGYGYGTRGYGNKLGSRYGYGNKIPVVGSYGYDNTIPEVSTYGSRMSLPWTGSYGMKNIINPFDDSTRTYDMERFSNYWTTNPIMSKIGKYFMDPTMFDESSIYYNLPDETVEKVKTTENLIDIIRELVKYHHNLPMELRTRVEEKFNLTHVIKFLLRVYYNIPKVKELLMPYYKDLPVEFATDVRTGLELKKVIKYIVQKYITLPMEEREFLSTKYFDIVPVIRKLMLSYYGIPKEFVHHFENVLVHGSEYGVTLSGEIDKKQLEYILENIVVKRNVMTETEKLVFDKFLNIKKFVEVLVRVYFKIPHYNQLPWSTLSGPREPTFLTGLLNRVLSLYGDEENMWGTKYGRFFNVPDYVKNVLTSYYNFPESRISHDDFLTGIKSGLERYHGIPTEFRTKYDMYYNVPTLVKSHLNKYFGNVSPYTLENIRRTMDLYHNVPEFYRGDFNMYHNVPEMLTFGLKNYYGIPEQTFGGMMHPSIWKNVLDKYHGLDEDTRINFDKYYNISHLMNPKLGGMMMNL